MITGTRSLMTTLLAEYDDTFTTATKAQWSPVVPVASYGQIQALQTVLRTASLPHDWDSYGSPPPSPMALAASVHLITAIDLDDLTIPDIFAVPGGGIQFEWRFGGRELELEVLPDSSLQFLKVERGVPLEEGQLKAGLYGEVSSLLSWLASR